MKTKKIKSDLSHAQFGIGTFAFFLLTFNSFAQNISVNTTGAANSTNSIFEVLQPSTTAGTSGIFVRHSGAIAGTGYSLWAEKTGVSTTNIAGYFTATGGTNNYALIVPNLGGNVGIGTTTPNASALLDVSSTTKGVLLPKVALSATNNNAPIGAGVATGLIVYNTATAGVFPNDVTPGYYWWNGQWERFSSNPKPAWYTTGNTGTNPAQYFLGTIDAQPIAIRSNNVERMRITPVGEVIIGGTA